MLLILSYYVRRVCSFSLSLFLFSLLFFLNFFPLCSSLINKILSCAQKAVLKPDGTVKPQNEEEEEEEEEDEEEEDEEEEEEEEED